jgi:hypothetical protein
MALVAGAKAVGSDFQNLETKTHDPYDSGTTTNITVFTTTRAAATSPVGVSFTAPPSGKVMVDWSSAVQTNTATVSAIATVQMQTGTTLGAGASVFAGGNRGSIQANNPTIAQGSKSTVVDGLTAGSDYNVTMMFRTSSNAIGTFSLVEVSVTPCIA